MTGEDRRQALHLSMTVFALALRWLTPTQACIAAGAAILVNWVVLPALGWDRSLRRENGPFADGVKLYPVAVLAVLLLFGRHDMAAAAAAWGVMGVGDAMSNLIGRRFGKPGFLGRADRSLVGTLAFVLTAWPAAWGLAVWTAPGPIEHAWLAALAAAVAGAVAELIPLPRWLDDNLPIALAAGAAFFVVQSFM